MITKLQEQQLKNYEVVLRDLRGYMGYAEGEIEKQVEQQRKDLEWFNGALDWKGGE